MLQDFGKLVAAVSPTCGMDLAFITDPGTAVKIMLTAGPEFALPVFASNAVTVGTLICVGTSALVSAFEPTPRIDATRSFEAPVAMDTAPPADGSIGSVVLKSSYQTDSVAIRYILDCAWGLRSPAGIAVVNGITW